MNSFERSQARVIPLRPVIREPLWRHVVGDVLRRERLAQERTLKDVADAARISMPYLSEVERGRKEASSEVLAAAARALGLGLADLLVLSQDELARLTQARSASEKAIRVAGVSVSVGVSGGTGTGAGTGVRTGSRRAEMCLAA